MKWKFIPESGYSEGTTMVSLRGQLRRVSYQTRKGCLIEKKLFFRKTRKVVEVKIDNLDEGVMCVTHLEPGEDVVSQVKSLSEQYDQVTELLKENFIA